MTFRLEKGFFKLETRFLHQKQDFQNKIKSLDWKQDFQIRKMTSRLETGFLD